MRTQLRLIIMEALGLMRAEQAEDADIVPGSERLAELATTIRESASGDWHPTVAMDPIEGYDAWADSYDDELHDEEIMGVDKLEQRTVRGILARYTPGRALDACCGTGRHSAYLASRGHAVVGVDTSSEMLAHARRRVPTGDFTMCGVEELPFEDGSFDLSLCALALSHIADPRAAICELRRVLAPGAPLVLSVPHPLATAILGLQTLFIRSDGIPAYVREFTHFHGTLVTLYLEAGFTIHSCVEPPLTAELARGMAPPKHADAFELALSGCPLFTMWELRRDD